MDRQVISQRITSILGDISRLQSALYAMNTTDIQRYPDNYEVLSTDAALRSESIACYLQSASVMHGIEIRYENGVLEVMLPSLLPKRKQRQSTEFLIDPVYFALNNYADHHPMPKFSHCVVCFSHIYSRELPARRVRDYDNLELKQLLDVISTFIMADDSGLLCDAYNTTELGEQDCTCISVMDQKSFSEWLSKRQDHMKSISDF